MEVIQESVAPSCTTAKNLDSFIQKSKWIHIDPLSDQNASKFSYTIAILQHLKSGATYRVVNAYLPEGEHYNREMAVHEIRSTLSLSSSDFNFLMGSFNVEPDSETYAQLADFNLGDAFQITQNQCRPNISTYNTFDPENKVHEIRDYIFT